jgi:regulator of protease activity HflC (stomatin/prohibitin superfamily)
VFALVLVILAGLVGGIAIVVAIVAKEHRTSAIVTAVVSGVLVVVFFISGTVIVVPNGNVAVMMQFGRVTGETFDAGLHFKAIVQDPINMNIQTQKYEEASTAASKDLQDVTATITINYKLDPAKAGQVFKTIGMEYIKVVGHPAIQETVKEVTAKFNAEDCILRRAEVKDEITKSLSSRLNERGIITEAVNITNFDFSQEFTAAIEAKVVAQQNVFQSQNKLQQVKVEAQQAEAVAVGKANAAIAEAEGQAKAIQIVTEAQVAANKTINETLTDNVLQYIFIDRMGNDVKVWVVPQGQDLTLGNIGQ